MRNTSYHFLLVLICCLAANTGDCQQMMAVNFSGKPQFISGMNMAVHYKEEVIENIVVTKNSTGEMSHSLNTPLPENKPATNISPDVVKKNELMGIKDSISIALSEPDTLENRDIALVATKPANVHTRGNKTTTLPATDQTSSDAFTYEEPIDPLISKYAEIISVDPEDINNYPLYRFIDQWYGVRYKWGGDDVSGIDCSAFSKKLYGKVYNVEILRTAKQQHRHCEHLKTSDEATEGDLVFFRIHHLRVSHVGIYLANGYFVHASRSQGVVISNLSNKYWRRRFAGCGRINREDKEVYESDIVQ